MALRRPPPRRAVPRLDCSVPAPVLILNQEDGHGLPNLRDLQSQEPRGPTERRPEWCGSAWPCTDLSLAHVLGRPSRESGKAIRLSTWSRLALAPSWSRSGLRHAGPELGRACAHLFRPGRPRAIKQRNRARSSPSTLLPPEAEQAHESPVHVRRPHLETQEFPTPLQLGGQSALGAGGTMSHFGFLLWSTGGRAGARCGLCRWVIVRSAIDSPASRASSTKNR